MWLDKRLEDWSEDKAIPSITFHIHSLIESKTIIEKYGDSASIVWRLL